MIQKVFSVTCASALMACIAFAQPEEDNLVESARGHWQEIEALATDRETMPEGVDRDVQTTRITRIARTLKSEIQELVERIQDNDAAGSADRAAVSELLEAASTVTRREIDHRRGVVADSQAARERDTSADSIQLEQRLTQEYQELDATLRTLLQIAEWKQDLAIDASAELDYLDGVVQERVGDLMARTELALKQRDDATSRLAGAAEDEKSRIETSVQVARESLHGAGTSLQATIEMMDARGLDATEAKELLVRATGIVTVENLDPAVLFGLVTQAWNEIVSWLSTNGTQVLFKAFLFLVILGVARVVAGFARRLATRALRNTRDRVPQLLHNMIVSTSGTIVMVAGLMVALSQVGIDVGPLLAGVGVAGFIVGFALQDTLSNFASGVMILFYHPFDVGDVVEAGGVAGTVHSMNLVSTTIRTFDNQILIVPNNKIWGDVIRNKTSVRTRRVDLTFGIGYGDDIAHAERILHEIVASHQSVLEDPAPTIKLHELGDSSVNFIVRPWVLTADYWDVHWDVTRAVKERFDAEGISIPFPQRDVHVHEASSSPAPQSTESSEQYQAPEKVSVTGISADDD